MRLITRLYGIVAHTDIQINTPVQSITKFQLKCRNTTNSKEIVKATTNFMHNNFNITLQSIYSIALCYALKEIV